MRLLLAGILLMTLAACGKDYVWDGSLENLMRAQPEHFATVLEDPARYRVQVLYTQIDRDADNRPSFRTFSFRANPDEYFLSLIHISEPTRLC